MRLALARSAAALIFALLVVAGTALAAGTVTVQVVSNDQPVEGAVVQVMATDGAQSYVTDQNGECTSDLGGQYFRLKVNGEVFPEIHNVSEGIVVVSIN